MNLNVLKLAVLVLIGGVVGLLLLEIGLRALKSFRFDGIVYLSGSTINNEPDRDLGWRSPRSISYDKRDDCFGSGRVSYNSDGFRGTPLQDLIPSKVVCLLGDSVLQAYQIPDGGHLASMLADRLRSEFPPFDVLSLGVGGYGTLQQKMLFERYCKNLSPAAVVVVWNENDPSNNDYVAERFYYLSSNNMRARPYLEGGAINMRRPYHLGLMGLEERSILLRMVNSALLGAFPGVAPYSREESIRRGLVVAEDLLSEVHEVLGERLLILAKDGSQDIQALSEKLKIRLVLYAPFPEAETCAPRDSHPNSKGHRRMFKALWPHIASTLAEPALNAASNNL